MNLRGMLQRVTPFVASEWFAASNLAFLAVDILVAHSENAFARREEWIPVIFSLAAALLLAPGLLGAKMHARIRPIAFAVGISAIAVGLAGMIFHLQSAFFEQQTLHGLVYTAPFVAPLAYVGLGLLVLLNRMEPVDTVGWAQWLLLLALGGAAGNLGLALLDHAQNGFFTSLEWVPVVAAAFGASFLVSALFWPTVRFLRWCLGVQGAVALVGVLGFALHLRADLHAHAASLGDRLIYGAPVFAPLLFADIAGLSSIAIWGLLRHPDALAARERRVA